MSGHLFWGLGGGIVPARLGCLASWLTHASLPNKVQCSVHGLALFSQVWEQGGWGGG